VPIVDILAVSPVSQTPADLHGFAIDSPTPGEPYAGHVIEIRGWILCRTHQPAALAILMDEKENQALKRALIQAPRPDVAQHYTQVPHAQHCGFSMQFSVLGLPENIKLRLSIRLNAQIRIHLATIALHRHQTVSCTYQPQLQPLMVTSLPRSGSTWLMHLLAQHPAVVAHRQYPYEAYAAKYWLYNLLKTCIEPMQYVNPSALDEAFRLHQAWATHHLYRNPQFSHWFGQTYLTQVADFCQQTVDGFYNQVAQTQGQALDKLTYFAEKFGPGYLTAFVHELYPHAKEIILVRDFRDVLCSMLAFTRKLGTAGFGLEEAQGDEAIVEQIHIRACSLLDYWQTRPTAHVVRYEDLLLEPEAVLTTLLTYLGLETTPIATMLTQDNADLQAHRTTPQPQASIGRWRQDLSDNLQRLCLEQLAAAMQAFGYGVIDD
jgi:hypothetical protein